MDSRGSRTCRVRTRLDSTAGWEKTACPVVWEGYLINEYPTLIGYLESGTYLIDNNLV